MYITPESGEAQTFPCTAVQPGSSLPASCTEPQVKNKLISALWWMDYVMETLVTASYRPTHCVYQS